jgi:hypothetical protein
MDVGSALLDRRAITISPPFSSDVIEDLQYEYSKWLKRLSKLNSIFTLYPEFAYNEKENTFRLHFHGIISMNNFEHFLKDIDYLKSKCFILTKPINNYNKWLRYCKKEISATKKLLGLKRNKSLPINNEHPEILRNIYNRKLKNDFKNSLLKYGIYKKKDKQ